MNVDINSEALEISGYLASLRSGLSNSALRNSGCSAESLQGSEGPSFPTPSLQRSPAFRYLHIGHLCKITFELKFLQLETTLKTGALET